MTVKGLFQNPWVQHIGFWTLSTYVLFRIFNQDPAYRTTDLIYTFLFEISLVIVVYMQLWVLIPKLLKPGRYLLYFLGFLASLGLGVATNSLTFSHLADRIFPGYYFISYYKPSELMQFMLVFALSGTLVKLSKSWFDLQASQKMVNRLEREKLDAELQALRAQLDPHFLFNSLNNVYSLALDGDEMVPDYLLKLSGNLRYMLYECKGALVLLSKELEYLENYLALQRLKTGEKVGIDWEVEGTVGEKRVAPLLFIPFVENSFKHGLKGRNPEPKISIRFELRPQKLYFHIRNSLPLESTERNSPLPQQGGIGLENVKKRLKLLYPGSHQLRLEQGGNFFDVYLQLDLT